MDFDQLKQILELVREYGLSGFEIEHKGLKVKIRKDVTGAAAPVAPIARSTATATGSVSSPHAATVPTTPAPPDPGEAEIELAVVKSPIVGTFYRSPEPSAPSFVEIGSTVKKGQVLCIIEAMKLMNEIDSEYDGEITTIYVENGQPVQYGERLFAIRTT